MKLDVEKTEQWKQAFEGYKGWIQVWKAFEVEHHGAKVCSPFQHVPAVVGWNKSNRKTKDLADFEKNNVEVHHGSHVLLDPAHYSFTAQWADDVIVPVYVKAKDLVAVGASESHKEGVSGSSMAVFTKFYLRKKDYENASKGIGVRSNAPLKY